MPNAEDIMTTKVITASPKDSIKHVIRVIVDNKVSGVPVVDGDGRVVGIVTEYDLILAVATVGHGLDIDHIMKKEVVTISDKTPVDEIMDIILTKRLKSFPILDAGGKLVGVVSRRDVLTELSTSA